MSLSRKGQKVDELLNMSTKELSRLRSDCALQPEVMQRLEEKRLSQKEAAEILGLSVRQVKRLGRSCCRSGAADLASKRRGRPSANQLDEKLKHKVLNLLHEKYKGFGPPAELAESILAKKKQIAVIMEEIKSLLS